MANEVTLPELGESVTDGIVIELLVEVGDTVEVDQALLEISTDKIDTEVPSPFAGTVQEILVAVDEEIQVGQVLMVIGDGEGSAASDGGDTGEEVSDGDDSGEEAASEQAPAEDPSEEVSTEEASTEDGSTASDSAASSGSAAPSGSAASSGKDVGTTSATGDAALLSPLVRKLLREAGMSADQVTGSGQGGRITREDAERAIADGPSQPAASSGASSGGGAASAPATSGTTPAPAATGPVGIQTAAPRAGGSRPEASPHQVDFSGEREVTQDLSRVRKAIARHMFESMQTTAQLTAAVEVDMTRVMNTRAALKDEFKSRNGASLSPLPIISRAVLMTLPRHPALNASMDVEAGTATYHSYVNLGMAVDTEKGLLVPNIKDAQDLTISGLAKRIADVARRTRGKGLQPDEISGGTFTITNTGSRGTLWDTPILNPPEVAILATPAIEKRPVVVNDGLGESIAIRWMTYLCLSYDHRMVDGADAARFMGDLKWVLENHDFGPEIAG